MSNEEFEQYRYENEFKEAHTKHLKRPAIVTIRKPFLTNMEMEDVLVRLLSKTCPAELATIKPNIVNRKRTVTPLAGIRGFLVDWTNQSKVPTTNENGDTVYRQVLDAVTTINQNASVYFVKSTTLVPDDPEKILNSQEVQTPENTVKVVASKMASENERKLVKYRDSWWFNATKTVANTIKATCGNKYVKMLQPFNPLILAGSVIGTETSDTLEKAEKTADIVEQKLGNIYYLVFLSESDNNEFKANVQSGALKRHSKEILQKGCSFEEKGLCIIYDDNDASAEKRVADVDTETKRCEFQFTKETAQRAFGTTNLKKKVIYGYVWRAKVKEGVFINQYLTSSKTRTENRATRFAETCATLRTIYEKRLSKNEQQKAGLGTAISTFLLLAAEQEQDCLRVLNILRSNLMDKLDDNPITHEFDGIEVPSTTDPRKYSLTYDINKACDRYINAYNNDFLLADEAFRIVNAKHVQNANNENAVAKQALIESHNYITLKKSGNANTNITFTQFKIHYYFVLLRKILDKFSRFFKNGDFTTKSDIIYIPLLDELNRAITATKDIRQETWDFGDKDLDLGFIYTCEELFYGIRSGAYITSFTTQEGRGEVVSQLYNSKLTNKDFPNIFGDYTDIGAIEQSVDAVNTNGEFIKTIKNNVSSVASLGLDNSDVANINIQRVTKGRSSATILINNANKRYNFKRGVWKKDTGNFAIENTNEFVIEPLDEVCVWLPTLTSDTQLNLAFKGVVESVTEKNDSGYHSLSVFVDDVKHYMHMYRTNIKPSLSKKEAGTTKITPFSVPMEYFQTYEKWLSLIFAQSLTTIHCMLMASTTENYDKPLFELISETIKPVYGESVYQEYSPVESYYIGDMTTTEFADQSNKVYDEYISSSAWEIKSALPITKEEWDSAVNEYCVQQGLESNNIAEMDIRTYITSFVLPDKKFDSVVHLYKKTEGESDPYKMVTLESKTIITNESARVDINLTGYGATNTTRKNEGIYLTSQKFANTQQQVLKQTVSKKVTGQTVVNKTKKVIVASYKPYERVKFIDPLLDFLWYQTNSVKLPMKESNIIEEAERKLLDEYVTTNTIVDGKEKEVVGIRSYTEILSVKPHASYNVYRTRFGVFGAAEIFGSFKYSTKLLGKEGPLDLIHKYDENYSRSISHQPKLDKNVVAIIAGTTQPTYRFNVNEQRIQFSDWKENIKLVSDIANDLNFLFYSTASGVLCFMPPNLSLTSLSTNKFNSADVNEQLTFTQNKANIFEASEYTKDNVQILGTQYITSFNQKENDKKIVNWITLSGGFQITDGVDTSIRAVVKDPTLITRFGYRSTRHIPMFGCTNAEALHAFGLAIMDRMNKSFRTADVSGLFDSRMDINLPYYIPHVEMIYWAENININYAAGDTCRYTMHLDWGRKPLFSLYDISKSITSSTETSVYKDPLDIIVNQLKEANEKIKTNLKFLLQKENKITPSVYIHLLNALTGYNIDEIKSKLTTENIENSAYLSGFSKEIRERLLQDETTGVLHELLKNFLIGRYSAWCYNGYIWDGISSLQLEDIVYDYYFVLGKAYVSNIITALSTKDGGKFNKLLIDYVFANGVEDRGQEKDMLSFFNRYFVDLQAVITTSTTSKKKDAINTDYIIDDDLEYTDKLQTL